jgi:hypothetical protein
MTKLTGLDLYILTETLLYSLQFGNSWTACSTQEAREGVIKKLQMIMNEMEVGLSPEEGNE